MNRSALEALRIEVKMMEARLRTARDIEMMLLLQLIELKKHVCHLKCDKRLGSKTS